MVRIRKGFSIKVISIIVAVLFIVTSNIYPDTLSTYNFYLRKKIDFDNKKEITPRYLCTMLAAAVHKSILEGNHGETFREILENVITKYKLPDLLEEIERQGVQTKIDKEKGTIWIYHETDNIYIALHYKDGDGQFGPKEKEDFNLALDYTKKARKLRELYFRPFERNGRVYEALGIRWFDQIWLASIGKLASKLAKLQKLPLYSKEFLITLDEGTRLWKYIHLGGLITYSFISYAFFYRDAPWLGVGFIVANIVINIYPLMSIRYNRANRAKIYRVLEHREERKKTKSIVFTDSLPPLVSTETVNKSGLTKTIGRFLTQPLLQFKKQLSNL